MSSCLVYKAGRNLTKHIIHSFDRLKDRAWKEQTTSIFDLETLEIEAERRGETAPWANPDGGDVQIKQIASEAEVVATRIYGKGMSAREQQVSV